MQDIQMANEERLNELDPDKRNNYELMKRENMGLMREIGGMRAELDNVNALLAKADAQLKSDTLRQRSHHLKKERGSLLKKKEELELQTNESNLSFPEARERLIQRIKQDNAEVLQLEKLIADYRKTVETYERNIKELEQDLQESKTESNDTDKYEVLHKKDNEMTAFMQEFPELRDKEAAQLKDFEMRIPKLLEHMSSQIARSTALPSKQEVKDKQDQMNYNENLVENAEETIVRIRMELETR